MIIGSLSPAMIAAPEAAEEEREAARADPTMSILFNYYFLWLVSEQQLDEVEDILHRIGPEWSCRCGWNGIACAEELQILATDHFTPLD